MKKKLQEEQPKQKIAKRVVTPKRRYFVPESGQEVEATSLSEVGQAVNKKVEDGDGNK